MAECGKGWTDRCARAKSRKCSCRCGGDNHGKARPVEEGGKPVTEIDEVLSLVVEQTIRPLAFAPRIIERYGFGDWPRMRRSETHLTICGKVVIATERDDNPGASITNAAENLWSKVREQFGADIIAVEHYPVRGEIKEDWDLVTVVDGSAHWSHLSRETLATLIANPATELDDDIETDVEDGNDDCAEEGHVFYEGQERELMQAMDSWHTRTPAHPFDGDEI